HGPTLRLAPQGGPGMVSRTGDALPEFGSPNQARDRAPAEIGDRIWGDAKAGARPGMQWRRLGPDRDARLVASLELHAPEAWPRSPGHSRTAAPRPRLHSVQARRLPCGFRRRGRAPSARQASRPLARPRARETPIRP